MEKYAVIAAAVMVAGAIFLGLGDWLARRRSQGWIKRTRERERSR